MSAIHNRFLHNIIFFITPTVIVAVMSNVAYAETMPLSLPFKISAASHIVTGKVKNIVKTHEKETVFGVGEGGGDASVVVTLFFQLDVDVEAVEKGDGIEKGNLLHAFCWDNRVIPSPSGFQPIGVGGQFFIPKPGTRVRLYLITGDPDCPEVNTWGGRSNRLEILMPNGVGLFLNDGTYIEEPWQTNSKDVEMYRYDDDAAERFRIIMIATCAVLLVLVVFWVIKNRIKGSSFGSAIHQ